MLRLFPGVDNVRRRALEFTVLNVAGVEFLYSVVNKMRACSGALERRKIEL